MTKIRNLCFDLGGVVMDIRRVNCIAAFRQLGMAHPEDFLGEYVQGGPFAGIENGSVDPAGFRAALRPYLGADVTDEQIDAAFMAFLIGIPEHRLDELQELRRAGFGMYLLSNTNPVMWNGKISEEFRKQGLSGPEAYFDGLVKSYEVKIMKPDAAIFELLTSRYGLKPEETLFLDDSEANCEAARRCGWKAMHIAPGSEFMPLLRQRDDLEYKLP